jgi:AGZA family xanthine/uracil permease-like MFS transporter
MMCKAAKDINWNYWGDSLPAFITLAVMPFTYSIAYGLIAGIISYFIINSVTWLVGVVSGGRIVPADIELREPWSWKVKGGFLPAWVVRATRGLVVHLGSSVLQCADEKSRQRDFWHDNAEYTDTTPSSAPSSVPDYTHDPEAMVGNDAKVLDTGKANEKLS